VPVQPIISGLHIVCSSGVFKHWRGKQNRVDHAENGSQRGECGSGERRERQSSIPLETSVRTWRTADAPIVTTSRAGRLVQSRQAEVQNIGLAILGENVVSSFRSRWTTPAACAAATPSATCVAMSRTFLTRGWNGVLGSSNDRQTVRLYLGQCNSSLRFRFRTNRCRYFG
jgi:hypothetical protein